MSADEKCTSRQTSNHAGPAPDDVRAAIRRVETIYAKMDRLCRELGGLDSQFDAWIEAGIDPGRWIGEQPWYRRIMSTIHYAEGRQQTVCGLSTGEAIHTDEPEMVSGCSQCCAAPEAPSGCPGRCGNVNSCDCYAEGYSHGKDKAHFEIRHRLGDNHAWRTCGCEPCITIRIIAAGLKAQP